MSNVEIFGRTADGDAVERVTISAGGLTVNVLTWGAVIQDLRLAGHDAPLVLGFDNFEDYPAHSPHFGAVPGRYANRIAHGRFILDGERYQTDLNQSGRHTAHGGSKGYSKRLWKLAEHGADFVALNLHSSDGDMGFPGNLEARCVYRLKQAGTLSIELTATADQLTLCNLTNHSYFNLDDGGAGDILGHRLVMAASAYLPVDGDSIPTGVVQPVDDTPFDFRLAREIHWDGVNYDHNFCLASNRGALRHAAWAQGAASGIEMDMWTTEPGVQFYAGHKVSPGVPGLGGRRYGANSGFCLEAQVWPDSPNRSYFPQALLRPGETYRHLTEYRFRQA